MPKGPSGLVKMNFMCDPDVLRGLRWLADSRRTSVSELIRAAIKEFIVRELKQEQTIISVLQAVPGAADD